MKENVWKRLTGAIIGIALGLVAAYYLYQTYGYNFAVSTFIVGAPIAAILARTYGGPISEAMGNEERSLTRRVKTVAIIVGAVAAFALGMMTGNIVNGIGLGITLLVVTGPRFSVLFDERMGAVYGKATTNAFAVFSLCTGYLAFYHIERFPGQVTVDTFILVLWVSWASLAVSALYYYFLSGE
ncbi:hypothetical protein JXL21_04190 [Candidatus Bathyarchaeota archaeon]|nr:hypothetical protein [Candidatus Bathyarchaeota archaeon]